ncbi:hypothetical protein SUGI_0001070 [Cryptomeria japonica]|uniref:phospholipase A1-IIdelta n=1 Tax=Cryptomeria japonica TaxID=3369 RepID=UPI002408A109|nr:phospholipase A1-IIdelta [Cryptomeria japonica]GLJ04675.1 hypothetical protein SUGI_0001070 [Cryptomeria japonica]
MSGDGIAAEWRAIHGLNNWEGMLEPLHLGLRKSLLLYGDLIQATYDAFISDPHSKYGGSSRYGKKDFFHKVALSAPGDYEVTHFLYATASVDLPGAFFVKSLSREAWSKESNWIGYVAVATDQGKQRLGRRDIVVAWRGTIRDMEWIDVLNPGKHSIVPLLTKSKAPAKVRHWYNLDPHHSSSSEDEDDDKDPKVMNGWYVVYTSSDPKSPFVKSSARDQVLGEIRRLLEVYKDEEVSITTVGHSLGAALAVLSAFDMVENVVAEMRPDVPVTAFVVGSPGVGNPEFKRRFDALPQLRSLHVVNVIDLIPLYPSRLLHYADIGSRLEIDTRKSPFLKESKNPSDWHNLQAQLHIVAGWQGKEEAFKLAVERSVALVNKSSDVLKDECLVPGSWWVEKNKGMVQDDKGMWVMGDLNDDDVPKPED